MDATAPAQGACELCEGLDLVRYDHEATARPEPFCGACGRRLRVQLVAGPTRAGLHHHMSLRGE